MVETEPCGEGRWRQVTDSLNLLYAHVNEIGVSQQQIKAQVEHEFACYRDALGALLELKQTGSMEDYALAFEDL